MDCQSLYMFISVATALSGGFASVNFAIRTYVHLSSRQQPSNDCFLRMVVWGMTLICVIPVSLLIIGHWVVLLLGSASFHSTSPSPTLTHSDTQPLLRPMHSGNLAQAAYHTAPQTALWRLSFPLSFSILSSCPYARTNLWRVITRNPDL